MDIPGRLLTCTRPSLSLNTTSLGIKSLKGDGFEQPSKLNCQLLTVDEELLSGQLRYASTCVNGENYHRQFMVAMA